MAENEDIRNAAADEMKALLTSLSGVQAEAVTTACRDLFALYDGLVSAGFTSDQALKLTIETMHISTGRGLSV